DALDDVIGDIMMMQVAGNNIMLGRSKTILLVQYTVAIHDISSDFLLFHILGFQCIMEDNLPSLHAKKNNVQATEFAIKQGWLHTVDIGYFDEGGQLFVVDRLKELINIYIYTKYYSLTHNWLGIGALVLHHVWKILMAFLPSIKKFSRLGNMIFSLAI
ncbi:hypothetical protein ACJX0J_020072, partial [Zea mays]